MICFVDPTMDAEVRRWTWLGIDKDTYARTLGDQVYKWHYQVEHVGFKYHGNSIMAAIGLVSLKYLDTDNIYRRQLAAWYDEALGDAAGIDRVAVGAGCESARHLYQVMVDGRDEVMVALNRERIYPGVHYRDNASYPMYADQPPCPRAHRASERVVSLPMHLQLSKDDVGRVCDTLKAIIAVRA
jgi:dTDP-4-amino-4,6-dideoxygalactose transaminase